MNPSSLHLRAASADDIRAVLGVDIDPEYCAMAPFGYAAERDGKVVAVGTITWDNRGVAWAWFNGRGAVPAITIHRKALAVLDMLREVGEPVLYTICDISVPCAEKWLRRLGFVRDETLMHPWGPVYRCDLST